MSEPSRHEPNHDSDDKEEAEGYMEKGSTNLQRFEEIGSPLSVETVKHQIQVIQEVMKAAMVEGTHYGVIPGCGDKPSLLKPGAEKLSLTFRLSPTYKIEKTDLGSGHREYGIVCTLTHIPSQTVFGEGVGSCSTMESKYRWRNASRVCPQCGKDTIIKGKEEYGGGWLCFAKKGGCGAKFVDHDEKITTQSVGKVENPDIADIYNTVLKIAKKRSHVDGVLTATAASDIFAQDLEDLPEEERKKAPLVKIPRNVKDKVVEQSLECIVNNDRSGLAQIWNEFGIDEQVVLVGLFNSEQRSALKKLMDGK